MSRTGHSARLIGVIGDMVQSRALPPARRAKAQQEFAGLVRELNSAFQGSVASRFVVTLGDEFQGLLNDAEVLPQLVWQVESKFGAREIRIGIGYGVLHTPIQKHALNIDGPVLHHARAALTFARDRRLLGGAFDGFGDYDAVLAGFGQTLRFIRSRWTDRQREVVGLIRDGMTQADAAKRLSISKQAVSEHAVAAGCDAYLAGERGWQGALKLAVARKTSRR